jgi:hypothetical protein
MTEFPVVAQFEFRGASRRSPIMEKPSAQKRKEIAQKAAKARWAKD